MRHIHIISFALALLALPLIAAPQKKTLPYSCDQVWAAVKRASIPPHYTFAMLDDAQKKGIVSTGTRFSGQRNLDIALSASGDKCTVSVFGAWSGIQNDDKGDLFKRLEAEIKTPSPDADGKK